MVSLFVRALGNCKDCDKRTTETGKSKETIREIIIHDNRPEFKTVGCFDRFVQVFIAVSVVSVVSLVSLVSVVPVVSFRCFVGFGGFGGFVPVVSFRCFGF